MGRDTLPLAMLLLSAGCQQPGPAPALPTHAPVSDAASHAELEPGEPPKRDSVSFDYKTLFQPASHLAWASWGARQCPDEFACLSEYSGFVMITKRGWPSVELLDLRYPMHELMVDDPSEAVLWARVEYAVVSLLHERGDPQARVHCGLASRLPRLAGMPAVPLEDCEHEPRSAEQWTLVDIDASAQRLQELEGIMVATEPGRRAALADLVPWEAKVERLGAHPLVRAEKVSPDGAIDEAGVRHTILLGFEGMRRCYIDALLKEPSRWGKVAFKSRVEVDGSISEVTLPNGALGDSTTEACMRDAARSFVFPRPEGGEPITLRFTLIFWPKEV